MDSGRLERLTRKERLGQSGVQYQVACLSEKGAGKEVKRGVKIGRKGISRVVLSREEQHFFHSNLANLKEY